MKRYAILVEQNKGLIKKKNIYIQQTYLHFANGTPRFKSHHH